MSSKVYTLLGASLFVLFAAPVFGQEKKPATSEGNYGIYYDSASGNYFTNSQPAFSIRPVGENKHIDRVEVSVNDSAFETYKGQIRFKTEGLHTIRFRAVDPVLNWSPVQTFRVFVDLKSPTSAPNWKGPHYKDGTNLFIHPDTKLTLSAEDNLSGVKRVQMKEAPDKAPVAVGEHVQFKKPGEYTIQYAGVDNVGNQEAWNTLTFKVDAQPPVSKTEFKGTAKAQGEKTYVNYGSSVSIVATDDASSVLHTEYRINEGPVTKYTGPIVLSEPVSRLRYRSVDRVGNEEEWKSVVLHQDTVPPMVQLHKEGNHVLAEGKIFASPGFAFKAQVSDNQSGLSKLTVSRDGQKYEDTKLDAVYKFDAPGTYQFHLKAFDNVGNASESSPLTVVIDNQPPVSKIKARQTLVPIKDYFLSGIPNSIDISGEDGGVGLKHIEVSYDGQNFQPLKGAIDLATWKSSRQVLYYRGVDALGNKEATQSVTIELSTTGPKVDLFVESDGMPEVPLHQIGGKPKPAARAADQRAPAAAAKPAAKGSKSP